MKRIVLIAVAIATLTACGQTDKTKFDAKEYAKHKTERLDKLVDLSDEQEKEVYSIYLAQGKEIKKNIKTLKNECCDMKHPDCAKLECGKAECGKPECHKAECGKPECGKAECKKAECGKPECCKAECGKPECHKAECGKAECGKPECGKPECGKPKHHPGRPDVLSPEMRKAAYEQIGNILTPEQKELLKGRKAKRNACEHHKQCIPTPTNAGCEK